MRGSDEPVTDESARSRAPFAKAPPSRRHSHDGHSRRTHDQRERAQGAPRRVHQQENSAKTLNKIYLRLFLDQAGLEYYLKIKN